MSRKRDATCSRQSVGLLAHTGHSGRVERRLLCCAEMSFTQTSCMQRYVQTNGRGLATHIVHMIANALIRACRSFANGGSELPSQRQMPYLRGKVLHCYDSAREIRQQRNTCSCSRQPSNDTSRQPHRAHQPPLAAGMYAATHAVPPLRRTGAAMRVPSDAAASVGPAVRYCFTSSDAPCIKSLLRASCM